MSQEWRARSTKDFGMGLRMRRGFQVGVGYTVLSLENEGNCHLALTQYTSSCFGIGKRSFPCGLVVDFDFRADDGS
jgi:hypothetical protein